MKKIFSNIMTATLLFAGVAFTACSNNDNDSIEPTEQSNGYKISISATKDEGTRSLYLDGSKLMASWTKDEAVRVYKSDNTYIGTIYAEVDGVVTTLSGYLYETYFSKDEVLTLKFCERDGASIYNQWGYFYNNDIRYDQSGTIEDIADRWDYAVATVKVTTDNEYYTKTTSAVFENQQAILKCTVKDSRDQIYVNFNGTYYNAYNGYATNVFYVAIPAGTGTLTVKDNSSNTLVSKDDVTLQNGKFYSIAQP
jgi:hypothetical protein